MFNFDKVQKASVLMEGGVIRLNYIGNDLVIIRGIDMDNAQQLMYLNDDGVIGKISNK